MKTKKFKFLSCQFCEYKFFVKETQRKQYKKYSTKTKEGFSALLKSLSLEKPKQTVPSVGIKAKKLRSVSKRIKKDIEKEIKE